MECPIYGSADVRFVLRNKWATPAFTEYICNGYLGGIRIGEADGMILNAEEIKEAGEEFDLAGCLYQGEEESLHHKRR